MDIDDLTDEPLEFRYALRRFVRVRRSFKDGYAPVKQQLTPLPDGVGVDADHAEARVYEENVQRQRRVFHPERPILTIWSANSNETSGIRQSDAHVWVEVWLNGKGWVRMDPTSVVAPERIEQGALADQDKQVQLAALLALADMPPNRRAGAAVAASISPTARSWRQT